MDLNSLPEEYKKQLIDLLNERREKTLPNNKSIEKVTKKTVTYPKVARVKRNVKKKTVGTVNNSSSYQVKDFADDYGERAMAFFADEAEYSVNIHSYNPGCYGCKPNKYGDYNDYCRCRIISSTPESVNGNDMAAELYNKLLEVPNPDNYNANNNLGVPMDIDAEDEEHIRNIKEILDRNGVTDKDNWHVNSQPGYYGEEFVGKEYRGDLTPVFQDLEEYKNNLY